MRNVRLWFWPGVAAVAFLAALAVWFTAGVVETELKARALAALRGEDGWAQVTLKGRDLTLTGLAPDEEDRDRALSVARSISGVRRVTDASVLLPEEAPYRFSAEKTRNGIVLGGFVPNETVRAEIISSLTGLLPGIALSDQMKLARGAPVGLASLAAYGLSVFPRFSTGSVEISDRSMRVSGQALDPDDHELALAALAGIPPSAGSVSAIDITPAAVSGSYTWAAARNEDRLTISGYIPDSAVRSAILSLAGEIGAGAETEDGMRFASGVPQLVDWLEATETGLWLLAAMSQGTVTLTDATLDVSGEARDAAAFRNIQDILGNRLPDGVKLGTADIGMAQGQPYEWSARLTRQQLELDGQVPDQAVHDAILSTARLKVGTIEIRDRMELLPGAPDGFGQAALIALQALSRLEQSEAVLKDRNLSVQGSALSGVALRETRRLIEEGLPEGFSGTGSLSRAEIPETVLVPADCQQQLDSLAGSNTVLFQTGDAGIESHSFGFLDRIAATVQQCGDVRMEISGHTDSDGSEADNLALSERRADAVADYLTAAGVDAKRLVAVGHGESRPVRENETVQGKAANRRIEFQVMR
ncbi:MAG: OmpA family protein [Hoeflea sp.]|nr:OmpA family protein [Hoeflea sp.]